MERLASAALRDLLARLGPAVDDGCVNVISVAAIRDRLGEKWGRRRQQVEDFVERAFTRLSPAGGMVVPLNDLEFITVHPGASKWTALGASAAILKETLNFFLGAVARDDLRLFIVTSVTDGELRVDPVDAGRFLGTPEPAPSAHAAPVAAAAAPDCAPGPLLSEIRHEGARGPAQLLSFGGRDYEARSHVQPTWNVRKRVVASFLVETTLETAPTGGGSESAPHESPLPPPVSADLAMRALSFAVRQIEQGRRAGAPAAMHVPLPWAAVSSSSARMRLMHALRELDPAIRRLVVAEIVDIAEGLPQGRLAEIVSIVAPSCRAVLARAPSENTDLLRWRRCGLNGISLDCAHLERSDRQALTRLSLFARNALALAPACIAYGLRSRSLTLTAWAAGFTHLSGDAVAASTREGLPMRVEPADLYSTRTGMGSLGA